jgi:hypothetical protein
MEKALEGFAAVMRADREAKPRCSVGYRRRADRLNEEASLLQLVRKGNGPTRVADDPRHDGPVTDHAATERPESVSEKVCVRQ